MPDYAKRFRKEVTEQIGVTSGKANNGFAEYSLMRALLFKEGYKAGINEVVEWVINHYWPDEHQPASIRKFYVESWQAKLKEWDV